MKRKKFDLGITIDASHSRDLDDAVWVEKSADGWIVYVTISDVASSVIQGSPVDDKAFGRVESKYYGQQRVLHMLPRYLAEDDVSLIEGHARRGLCTRITLTKDLRSHALPEFEQVWFTNRKRFSQEEVPLVIADAQHPWHEPISQLVKVASGLMERRRNAGAFVMYDLNSGWVTTEEGALKRLKDTRETIGYIVVQELMILANAEVARFCAAHEIAVPWRNHVAKAHAPERRDLMERIRAAVNTPLADVDLLRKQTHMTMNRAEYGPQLRGHYGLNLPAYLHSTSPIRRYADLVTQRQLVAWINGRSLPYSYADVAECCLHINTKIEIDREMDHDFGKEEAMSRAEERLRAEDLIGLGTRDFERVVKLVARSGTTPPEEFVREYQRRIDLDVVALVDVHTVLFEAPRDEIWQPLRQKVLQWLAHHPHHAVSITTMAQQLSEWGDVRYEVKRFGPDHGIRHRARASMRKQISISVEHGQVKVAKQRACVSLLANALDLETPVFLEESPDDACLPPLTGEGDSNAVSALNQYAQRLGRPLPVYVFERQGGADHEPSFSATCTFLERGVVSSAANKKAAKQDAAQQMVELLNDEGGIS